MKNRTGCIKLSLNSQMATPCAALAATLGQKGINVNEFCKSFNKRTALYEKGRMLRTKIVFKNNKFEIFVKIASLTFLIKALLNVKKLNASVNSKGLKIKLQIVFYIVKQKINDMNTRNIRKNVSTVLGFLKSAGIQVER